MLQRQHSQFNSPCKYTEMKAGSHMFFAVLSRFHSIMLDASVQRLSSPYYGRASKVFSYVKDDFVWFLVRHGEPFTRESILRTVNPKACSIGRKNIAAARTTSR